MIIGLMCIERACVAFVAIVVTTSLSQSENSSLSGSVDVRIVRQRSARRNPQISPQMRLKAVTVSEPKVPGPNILFVRLTRRYIPIVRVTGVR
jgi:hypothetical protein